MLIDDLMQQKYTAFNILKGSTSQRCLCVKPQGAISLNKYFCSEIVRKLMNFLLQCH